MDIRAKFRDSNRGSGKSASGRDPHPEFPRRNNHRCSNEYRHSSHPWRRTACQPYANCQFYANCHANPHRHNCSIAHPDPNRHSANRLAG